MKKKICSGIYLKNPFIEKKSTFKTVRFKMVRFNSKWFGYCSRTVIKLMVWFMNHYNGSVNFGLVQCGSVRG